MRAADKLFDLKSLDIQAGVTDAIHFCMFF